MDDDHSPGRPSPFVKVGRLALTSKSNVEIKPTRRPMPLVDRTVTNKSRPALPLSFTRDLPLTQAAVEFARERHSGQVRSADGAPFIAHPIETAFTLESSHYPDHVLAAAVLHDVLEDTWTTRAELEERFGRQVAEIVATLSVDPSIADERERRADLRERVRQAGGYVAAVYAADKVSKVRELRAMLALGVDAAEIPAKSEHYERSLAMLEQVIPGSWVVELLRFELEELAALPPQPLDISDGPESAKVARQRRRDSAQSLKVGDDGSPRRGSESTPSMPIRRQCLRRERRSHE